MKKTAIFEDVILVMSQDLAYHQGSKRDATPDRRENDRAEATDDAFLIKRKASPS